MAAAGRFLFAKDDNRKAFGIGMLPKLKDLKGKLHGFNFPKARRDSKSIPVISVIPPTPKSEKAHTTTQSEDDTQATNVTTQISLDETTNERNNNSEENNFPKKETLRIRRISNQRRHSEPTVLSDTEGESLDSKYEGKDFLQVPAKRRNKRRRRKRVMKKSMSADDIVTLQWLAVNSIIDHGVAEFCSDGAMLDVVADESHSDVDQLVKFMVGDGNSQQTKSPLDGCPVSKSEASLLSNDKKLNTVSSNPNQRSMSYHSLLYDFDVASSYQIYQPTVYDVEEDGIFSQNTTKRLRENANRNSERFKKAFDQGQVYFDNIVDMIKTKAEQQMEARKTTSLPIKSRSTSLSSNKYILNK